MFNWVKTHKLTTALLVIVGYFLFSPIFSSIFGVKVMNLSSPLNRSSYGSYGTVTNPASGSLEMGGGFSGVGGSLGALAVPSPSRGVAADVPADARLIVQNSNLSLLVSDVRQTGDKVVKYAVDNGGFMVNTSYNRPEESPFATITVRVPSVKLDEALGYFRSQAIKVTNENLVGTDVTEQYVDIEARLSSLEKVKGKFEGILDAATEVQDILTVQRELINTQSQIDALKGQKQALEENAQFAKLTVYLSTDELSLPYTPDTKFRPDVVFKLAVRSLLNTLRVIGEGAIWLVVYAVVWVPVVLIVVGYRRWKAKRVIKQ